MKATLLMIGKTDLKCFDEGMNIYHERLKHYFPIELQIIPDIKAAKSFNNEQIKEAEGTLILKNFKDSDTIVLLDEKGQEYSSVNFARFMGSRMQEGKRIFFVIGGPFGFSEAVYRRANFKISLSKMTFSHQMVRVFFMEQLYRAMTIIRGEKYHHE